MGQPDATMGAPLAMRGTNDYLRAISDQPKVEKDIAEIVKTAKLQLEEEKKQTTALEKVVVEQITVNM
jgi:TusA-related sulfurtransferase